MEAIGGIKVYECGEDEWWAAATPEEAMQCMADSLSCGDIAEARAEYMEGGDPVELTDKGMSESSFYDEDENEEPTGEPRTFLEQLQRMVTSGQKFPCHFASGNL